VLLRQWLAAGVLEDEQWTRTMAGTPQGGVISPLPSNIYLHVLDRVWEDWCAHVGTLVRYADDFVVMCDTKRQVEEARRVSSVLTRLGLELHPEKIRTVDLSRGRDAILKRIEQPMWLAEAERGGDRDLPAATGEDGIHRARARRPPPADRARRVWGGRHARRVWHPRADVRQPRYYPRAHGRPGPVPRLGQPGHQEQTRCPQLRFLPRRALRWRRPSASTWWPG
jgi:hypothetical protein